MSCIASAALQCAFTSVNSVEPASHPSTVHGFWMAVRQAAPFPMMQAVTSIKHASSGMQGLKAFQEAEGVVPDIVSIATNYWDIAAL